MRGSMDTRSRWLRPAPLFLLGWLLSACLVNLPEGKGPAHSWWQGHGPVIPHETFPLACDECHLPGSWNELREDFSFDHAKETGIPLEGAHDRAQCLRCHNDRGPVNEFAARGCRGCHEDRHQGRLGSDCSACHGQVDWSVREAIAQHDQTRFPLVGAHAAAGCFACHPGAEVGQYDRAPIECFACHAQDYAGAMSPDHRAQGWSRDCQDCHSPVGWRGAWFAHNQFPLVGAHGTASCADCHAGEVYAGTPQECVACHLDAYTGTTSPNHSQVGFSQDCQSCHSPFGWEGTTWSHPWPLTGAHAGADCLACHSPGDFSVLGPDCVDCHLADYNGTTSPNHSRIGFSQDCQRCHSPFGWESGNFSHRFPRDHGKASGCSSCHGTPTTASNWSCITCHSNPGNLANEHDDVRGYDYLDNACLTCHPNGQED